MGPGNTPRFFFFPKRCCQRAVLFPRGPSCHIYEEVVEFVGCHVLFLRGRSCHIFQEVVEFAVCHLLRQVDVPSRQRIPSTGARDHITWMITPWAPSTGARDHIKWLILSLIHISEPTRLGMISYAVFCLKKKKA